ncbi:MAG: hypothetical protein AAF517_27870, partial [Planctomycetota bacterium]
APFRSPKSVYELQGTLKLRGGVISLPTRDATFERELFEEVLLGPDQVRAEPLGPGRFRVRKTPQIGGFTSYRFDYSQDFELPDGTPYSLNLLALRFVARGNTPRLKRLPLSENFITHHLTLEGETELAVPFSSCTYSLLPLWTISIETESGDLIELEERFEPAEALNETGPANIVGSSVLIAGERREVDDYWRLVYAAQRHNLNAHYWVFLDSPIDAGLERPVAVVEVFDPDPTIPSDEELRYLDAEYTLLANMAVSSFEKRDTPAVVGPAFRRGDVDASGDLNLSDAVALLRHLFLSGARPACEVAGDTNANGRLELSDGVRLLLHLFQNAGPLPEPFETCGWEEIPGPLPCEMFPPCN